MKNMFQKSGHKAKTLSATLVTTALLSQHGAANATGFSGTAANLTGFFGAVQTTILAAGVMGGLGAIAWGASQLLKKSGDRGEDITWMSIGLKVMGGALLMTLSWVASQAMATLGAPSR